MTNYAYLRVSSDSQDVANQKHGIYEYCNTVDLANLCFFKDIVTGKKKSHQRKLGSLIEGMSRGDKLVCAEISSIARSTQSKITATILGLAARKKDGVVLANLEALTLN